MTSEDRRSLPVFNQVVVEKRESRSTPSLPPTPFLLLALIESGSSRSPPSAAGHRLHRRTNTSLATLRWFQEKRFCCKVSHFFIQCEPPLVDEYSIYTVCGVMKLSSRAFSIVFVLKLLRCPSCPQTLCRLSFYHEI